jgi:hypothetical protein
MGGVHHSCCSGFISRATTLLRNTFKNRGSYRIGRPRLANSLTAADITPPENLPQIFFVRSFLTIARLLSISFSIALFVFNAENRFVVAFTFLAILFTPLILLVFTLYIAAVFLSNIGSIQKFFCKILKNIEIRWQYCR